MDAALSFVGKLDTDALGGRYLGPATVTCASVASLEVRLPTGELVHPRMALAFPFSPAKNDSLLVIGQDECYFVIGVIESTGKTELRFRGNVDVCSLDGELDLHGEKGVQLHSPEIEIKTKKLNVVADKATEVFGTLFTRVKELMSVHSGKTDTIVRGLWSSRSKRAAITSEDVITINGKEVHLG